MKKPMLNPQWTSPDDVDEIRKFREIKNTASREHLLEYMEPGNAKGYVRPLTPETGYGGVVHLVLRTVGRTSGKVRLIPLVYAPWADEYVIVASKSGDLNHPAWFLNLTARPEVEWQVLDKRFTGTWRVAEGEDRKTIWDSITQYFPVFAEYQSRTPREMPVVVLTATGRIEEKWEVPEDAYRDITL